MSRNLYRHLQLRHPEAYKRYKRRKNLKKSYPISIAAAAERRISWTRKYYTKMNEHYLKCVICARELKKNTNNGNMHRHMKLMHPYIYFKETDLQKSTRKFQDRVPDTPKTEVFYIKNIEETKLIEEDKTFREAGSLIFSDEEENSRDNNEAKNETNDSEAHNKTDEISKDCDAVHLSLDDPELNHKIKALCDKLCVGRRHIKSSVWNFFNVIEPDRVYRCGFCQRRIIIFPQSVSNLRRHLAVKHQEQYKLIKEYDESDFNRSLRNKVDKDLTTDEITFLDLENNGEFKCMRCDEIIECLDSEKDVLMDHANTCWAKVAVAIVDEGVNNKIQVALGSDTIVESIASEDVAEVDRESILGEVE